MNDEVSVNTIRFAITVTKITGGLLLNGMKKFIYNCRHGEGQGKQSVRKLVKQGQGASSMEVSGESMHQFKRIANKYGVDFAIVKDKTTDPSHFTVFFKAKDMDAIAAVVKEYSAKVVKLDGAEKKPSILGRLKELKERAATIPHKVREKIRENSR